MGRSSADPGGQEPYAIRQSVLRGAISPMGIVRHPESVGVSQDTLGITVSLVLNCLAAAMGTATRAMSASVKKGMQVYSALSQYARKAAILQMGFVLSQGSASARQAGRKKTAHNASPSQAVRLGHVQNHMNASVRKDIPKPIVIY